MPGSDSAFECHTGILTLKTCNPHSLTTLSTKIDWRWQESKVAHLLRSLDALPEPVAAVPVRNVHVLQAAILFKSMLFLSDPIGSPALYSCQGMHARTSSY